MAMSINLTVKEVKKRVSKAAVVIVMNIYYSYFFLGILEVAATHFPQEARSSLFL